jgi:hypothetical protein
MERIAQVLHDANKDWIRAQSSRVVSLHACSKAARLIALFAALYPRECVTNASGWLLIHNLRILREPDEEVTPEDIVTIKLLVAAWPESANIPINSDDSDDPDDPDEKNTVYNAVRARGSSSCSATSSAYAPPASPLPPHCAAELPAQARYACAAVL